MVGSIANQKNDRKSTQQSIQTKYTILIFPCSPIVLIYIYVCVIFLGS